jgi:hypothetical protein
MLNESTEAINCNNLEIVKFPLSSDNVLILELRFALTSRKKYLIREALIINGEIISEQLVLAKIKAFAKKFIHRTNNSSHENAIFEYATKQNSKGDTIRSLRLKKIFGSSVYFSEIDIEAMLNVWNEALIGYSKIKIFDNHMVFSTNDFIARLYGDNIFIWMDRNTNNQIIQNLEYQEFNSSKIVELIEEIKKSQ